MNLLLDTHFLIWVLTRSERLSKFPWLDSYLPWGVSPVSLLEIQFLSEIGRVGVRNPELTRTLMKDRRFIVDEVSLVALIRHAVTKSWTRDPFDRLLAAHSSARRVSLCTVDRGMLAHHSLVVDELSGPAPDPAPDPGSARG